MIADRLSVEEGDQKSDGSNSKPGNTETKERRENYYSEGVNRGLPKLKEDEKPVSFFEFWPVWLFYVPVVFYWLFLSIRFRSFGLPMLVNPDIHLGGMVGESKNTILNSAGKKARSYILPYLLRENFARGTLHKCDDSFADQAENDILEAKHKGVLLPFVVKPELGCRGAGVRVINSKSELVEYLREFPLSRRYIIQQLSPYAAEAGVFYERFPGHLKGRVTSITLKYRPTVVGDGVSSLKTLILKNKRSSIFREYYFKRNAAKLESVPQKDQEVALSFAGSHCRGSIFRNGNVYINDQLSKKIDEIMQDFPLFHYGRLDVKFRNMKELQRGLDFYIIEVNGVSSEKTHIWDSHTRFISVFTTLFEQYRTLFKMGNALRDKGYKVPSVKILVKTWISERNTTSHYPSTD